MITALNCPWCLRWLNERKEYIEMPPNVTEVSHVMCRPCAEEQQQKIKQLKERKQHDILQSR